MVSLPAIVVTIRPSHDESDPVGAEENSRRGKHRRRFSREKEGNGKRRAAQNDNQGGTVCDDCDVGARAGFSFVSHASDSTLAGGKAETDFTFHRPPRRRYNAGMAGHRWSIRTPKPHTVEVQHATHSARVRISVDGEIVFSNDGSEPLWDTGFRCEFQIDDKPCRLTIRGAGRSAKYDLELA